MRTLRRPLYLAVSSAATLYLAILLYPQALFAYTGTHGRFTVYTATPPGAALLPVLARADSLLSASPLPASYDEGQLRLDVLRGR